MLNQFSSNINGILKQKGLSQADFARLLNVRNSTVNQWVKGKREPEFDVLLKICLVLNIEPSELLGYNRVRANKELIIRDLIGNNPNFQKEQMTLLDGMDRQHKTGKEKQEADELLYMRYHSEYDKLQ